MMDEDKEIKEILATHGYTIEEAEGILNNAGRAIYQAGIREVVKWSKGPCLHGVTKRTKTYAKRDCPECWQAQLKSWGIDGN